MIGEILTFLITKLRMLAASAIKKIRGMAKSSVGEVADRFIRSLDFEKLIEEEIEKGNHGANTNAGGIITDHKTLETIFFNASSKASSLYNRVDVLELFQLTYEESIILDKYTSFSSNTAKNLSSSSSSASLYRRALEQINKSKRSMTSSRFNSGRKGMGLVLV